ncbi:hypothetical protein VYU27_000232 [Nannochloropsis oceanica]
MSHPPLASYINVPVPSSCFPAAPEVDDLRSLLLGNAPEAYHVNAFIERLTGGLNASKPGDRPMEDDLGFDPVALDKLFTVTLERIGLLGKETDERIGAMQEEGRYSALQRQKELDRHHRALQEVYVSIEDIESHFRKVGLTAVRIGQSLSQTESQRQKAEHAQRLLEYFLAFDTLNYEAMLKDAESERIEMLSNEVLAPLVDGDNYQTAARILSDLNVICEDLNAPHLENAVCCIRVFGERLESLLLGMFEAAAMGEGGQQHQYQQQYQQPPQQQQHQQSSDVDIETMRDCAVSLLKFGDPVKLYNTYIYTILAKQVQAVAARRQGGNDDAKEMRDALSEFFGLISALCRRAFTLIRQVFPPSASLKVTRMLIDRMVNDPAFGIQVRVAEVLKDDQMASEGSSVKELPLSPGVRGHHHHLHHHQQQQQQQQQDGGGFNGISVSDSLDMLLIVHDKTNALAADLIEHCVEAERHYLEDRKWRQLQGGLSGTVPEDDSEDGDMRWLGWNNGRRTAHQELEGGGGGGDTARGAPVGARSAGGGRKGRRARVLISPSQEALSSYVKIQFAELFVGQRESYLEKEVSLLRMRLVDCLAAAVGPDIGLTDGNEGGRERGCRAGKSKKKMIEMGFGGESEDLLPAVRFERVESYEIMLQHWLRKEVLASFLDSCRDALSRNAKIFQKEDERADNVLVMLSVVHKFLASSVLLPSLSAASNLVQLPSSGAPSPAFYEALASVHTWINSYKEFFQNAVLPEVQSKTTTQTVLLDSCHKFLASVERAGAKTVECCLSAIMRTAEQIHRELLRKSDYLPKDNTLTELEATRACLTISDCLHRHIELLRRSLPPNDVRIIVAALALRVQAFLMARMKHLRINTSGALILMQDCEIIFECFLSLYSPASTDAIGCGHINNKGGANSSMGSTGAPTNLPRAALVDNFRDIKAAFDDLKEVVGLFIVPPFNLALLMSEGFLSTQDRNELFLYISMRADFRTHGMISPWVRNLFSDVREDLEWELEEEGASGRHYPVSRPASPLPGGGSPS